MDNRERIPSNWPAELFVHALKNKSLIWTYFQQNIQCEKDVGKRLSQENLIADKRDESRCSETNKLIKLGTTDKIHASQSQGKKAGGQCDTYGSK